VQNKFIPDVKEEKLDGITTPTVVLGLVGCEICPPTVCGEMNSSAEYCR
jgi:hypothetical protein